MKYTNLVMALTLVSFATSCKDDNTVVPEPANPGENVKFSASMSETSRTIYDGETSTGLKISWTKGDKIAVASPQGSRTNGLYEVNIGDTDKQNYANSLDMIGQNGVQWGNAADGYNFYAVYPAASANILTVSGNTVSAKGYVPVNQVNFLPNDYDPTNSHGTTSYPLNPDNQTMEGQFLYAQTPNQKSGETVNLKFTAASTTLYMTFAGYTHTGNLPEGQADQLMIRSITLTAPQGTNIAGDFNVQFNADATTAPVFTASAGGTASNSVTVNTLYQTESGDDGRFLTIKEGQNFSIKMIINPMLAENLTIDSNWTISVNTAAGTFSKKLSSAEGANTVLKAGMVHKMTFGTFTIEGDELWQFTPESWMAQIPDNVYITELSLPGAWYAWDGSHTGKSSWTSSWDQNEGYQESSATISKLFNAGIRAFQVETRVGFTGDAQRNIANGTIVINGTGKNATVYDYYEEATALSAMIDAIQTELNTAQTEYAVLAISYSDGGSKSMGDDCKSIWINKIQSILSSYSNIVYASEISPNTTLNNVRNKLIVLVCVDKEIENNVTTWPNALFAYTNMAWDPDYLDSSLISPMTWKSWPGIIDNVDISTVGNNGANLYLNYTLANRIYASRTGSNRNPGTWSFTPTTTAEIATLDERKQSISTIIANSDQLHVSKKHNAWFFIGAGGTFAPDKSTDSYSYGPSVVAGGSKVTGAGTIPAGTVGLNDYLLQQVQSKIANNKPSPIGLVFINQATNQTYSGPVLIREIFEMNNQFYLDRDETPTPQNSPANYSMVNNNGGNAWNITK